jgi:hypothetical protein
LVFFDFSDIWDSIFAQSQLVRSPPAMWAVEFMNTAGRKPNEDEASPVQVFLTVPMFNYDWIDNCHSPRLEAKFFLSL